MNKRPAEALQGRELRSVFDLLLPPATSQTVNKEITFHLEHVVENFR